MYVEQDVFGYGTKGFQGETFFTAPNPEYGAVVTYYLRDGYTSLRDQRLKEEGERRASFEDNPYPSWDRLREEDREPAPVVADHELQFRGLLAVFFTQAVPELQIEIRNDRGETVRRITGPT